LIVGSGIFWVLYHISKGNWIGDGDYRLGIAIGLFLANPLLTWLSLFIASILGLIIMLPRNMRSKEKLKVKIPYGPFLILGLYFSYLFGARIIDWYYATFLNI
jgi:prepilin signal peptidase PulO-like enzyme (type II secretory pathway)